MTPAYVSGGNRHHGSLGSPYTCIHCYVSPEGDLEYYNNMFWLKTDKNSQINDSKYAIPKNYVCIIIYIRGLSGNFEDTVNTESATRMNTVLKYVTGLDLLN